MAITVMVLLAAGCGGGGDNSDLLPATGFKQVGATYVGRATCRDCHVTTDDQYDTQNHGLNFRVVHGDQITGYNGGCASCHTTGFGEASGYNHDGSTPRLEGIGCESCHGPGSKHVAADSIEERRANITRVPPAEDTCWTCHVNGQRFALDQPMTEVNALSLRNTVPNKVAPHHPQAMFLLGLQGYDTPATPSPHTNIPNTCVTCHMKYETNPENNKMDHSLAMLEPDLDFSQAVCASCHAARDTFVQVGVEELLIKLGGAFVNGMPNTTPENGDGLIGQFVRAHNIDVTTNAAPDDPNVQAFKMARYNYIYVEADKSDGVHNPGFAKKLLDDAIAAMTP